MFLYSSKGYFSESFTYLMYKFICKDGIERIPRNHFNFLFNLRISLHLRKIQFRILLEKKKEEKYHSISLILLARSNAVYSNIKFPIVLSINCNLPKEKKKLTRRGKGRVYDIRTKGKRKTKLTQS